jgi:hypothetical protein
MAVCMQRQRYSLFLGRPQAVSTALRFAPQLEATLRFAACNTRRRIEDGWHASLYAPARMCASASCHAGHETSCGPCNRCSPMQPTGLQVVCSPMQPACSSAGVLLPKRQNTGGKVGRSGPGEAHAMVQTRSMQPMQTLVVGRCVRGAILPPCMLGWLCSTAMRWLASRQTSWPACVLAALRALHP